jgi:hypothetical protein
VQTIRRRQVEQSS